MIGYQSIDNIGQLCFLSLADNFSGACTFGYGIHLFVIFDGGIISFLVNIALNIYNWLFCGYFAATRKICLIFATEPTSLIVLAALLVLKITFFDS